jgi:hypothetical protein
MQLASVHRALRVQSDGVDSIEGSKLREELDNNAMIEELKCEAYEVVLCFVSHRPREDPSQSSGRTSSAHRPSPPRPSTPVQQYRDHKGLRPGKELDNKTMFIHNGVAFCRSKGVENGMERLEPYAAAVRHPSRIITW